MENSLTRKYINKIKTFGTLEIINHKKYSVVECEFEYDIYSRDNMKGDFIFNENFDKELHESIHSKFIFKDKANRIIEGIITGYSINQGLALNISYLHFNINEYCQIFHFSDEKSVKLKIEYQIPFIKYFERFLKYYYGIREDYVLKFGEDEKIMNINRKNVRFYEFITFTGDKGADSKMHKFIYPTFEFPLRNGKSDLDKKIKLSEDIINDILLIFSLVFDHYLGFFGKNIYIYNKENKLIKEIKFRTSEFSKSEEYLEDHFQVKFSNIFTISYIAKIINKFRKYKEKDKLRTAIHRFRATNDIKIFESQVIWAFLALESMTSIIKRNGRLEEKLLKTTKLLGLDIKDYSFKENIRTKEQNKKRNKYLISDYRNDIVHSKFNKFEFNEIYKEFKKLRQLNRDLIFSCLDKTYKSFPFPI